VTIEPGQNSVFDAVLAPSAPVAVKPEWEEANVRANELFKAGRYEEAAAAYREILTSTRTWPPSISISATAPTISGASRTPSRTIPKPSGSNRSL